MGFCLLHGMGFPGSVRDMRRMREGFTLEVAEQLGQSVALKLRLATPMIGGGSQSGKPDRHHPFRSAAIRGQLRYWWRAQNAHEAGWQERERKLFGGTHGPQEDPQNWGRVSVAVRDVAGVGELVRLDRCADVPGHVRNILTQENTETEKRIRKDFRGDREAINRAMQQHRAEIEKEKDELFPWVVPAGATFTVEVRLPTEPDEELRKRDQSVLRAVRAWATFGGVGARTRRGCGAVEPVDPNYAAAFANTGQLIRSAEDGFDAEVPSLRGAVLGIGPRRTSARSAWFDAISLYQCLRKSWPADYWNQKYERRRDDWVVRMEGEEIAFPDHGADSHTSWPETLAALAAQGDGSLRDFGSAWPRAFLGMPIGFRYTGHVQPRPPQAFMLSTKAKGQGRYGSPLIVRAIKHDGAWRAGWLLLNAPAPPRAVAGERQVDVKWSAIPEDVATGEAVETLRGTLHAYLVAAGWEVR